MKFSEARQSYLAHRIVSILRQDDLAEVENERHVLLEIKKVLGSADSVDAAIDAAVRRKIATLSRRVPPGSREFDVLYRQYFTEEQRKRGMR